MKPNVKGLLALVSSEWGGAGGATSCNVCINLSEREVAWREGLTLRVSKNDKINDINYIKFD